MPASAGHCWPLTRCGARPQSQRSCWPSGPPLRHQPGSAGPFGLGLDVTGTCALRYAYGCVSRHLFAIGPIAKAAFWEMTAVPDLRRQCEALATHLSGLLGGLPMKAFPQRLASIRTSRRIPSATLQAPKFRQRMHGSPVASRCPPWSPLHQNVQYFPPARKDSWFGTSENAFACGNELKPLPSPRCRDVARGLQPRAARYRPGWFGISRPRLRKEFRWPFEGLLEGPDGYAAFVPSRSRPANPDEPGRDAARHRRP